MPKHAFDRQTVCQLWRTYGHLIVFVVTLLVADFFWKLTVKGDEAAMGQVIWLGVDMTDIFNKMADNIVRSVYRLLSTFKPELHIHNNILVFDNGNSTSVVWSCTPLKQIFVFVSVMLSAAPVFSKKALHKLWYVPLCAILLYAFNMLRIAAITLVVENHPELFTIMHTYIFKYVFYGFLFCLWLLWVKSADKQ